MGRRSGIREGRGGDKKAEREANGQKTSPATFSVVSHGDEREERERVWRCGE